VGAFGDDDNGTDSGSAYVFERSDSSWNEIAKLTASDGASGDYFGLSVSISGDYAIVGAYGDDDNDAPYSGSAYVFERSDSSWNEIAKLTASDGTSWDQFGRSVSISGDYAIVGAFADYANGNYYSGSAYVFSLTPPNNPAVFRTEKIKVCWHHNDLHVEGQIILPDSIWMDSLSPVGYADLILTDVYETGQDVEFEIKGKKNEKWEYKDKDHLNGYIKEFKIDWKSAKFDYHEDLHLHTHFISESETSFCIHANHVSGAFTVDVDGTTIAYDENHNITTNVEYEQQKDDNSHVHFSLPFQLTSDMVISITGTIEDTINIADHYSEGYGKFKIVSSFNSELFPDGTDSTPDIVEYFITLGDDMTMIFGGDTIGGDKIWTKKDDKHWEFKLK
jgi:hypothetical protein